MAKKHAHHGGAWKVAYADFTTAMMALFLVLWLTAQDQKIREAVARAFTNPFSSVTAGGLGVIDKTKDGGSKGESSPDTKIEVEMLRRLSHDLARLLQQQIDDPDTPVRLTLTSEGIRINVFDRANRPIFQTDSAKFTEYGGWVFTTLAWELSQYPKFILELEGHTESGRPPVTPEYTVWELSVDRANAARRRLLDNGVKSNQIRKVAGFGDGHPLAGFEPSSPNNRRVSVLLHSVDDSAKAPLATAAVSPP